MDVLREAFIRAVWAKRAAKLGTPPPTGWEAAAP